MLLVTPVVLLLGFPLLSPEGGPLLPILIFPYAGLAFAACLATANVSLYYLAFFLMLIQFPVYCLVIGLGGSKRSVWLLILVFHVFAVLLGAAILLFMMGVQRFLENLI